MAARDRYTVKPSEVDRIIIHRAGPKNPKSSQYLIRWKSSDVAYPPLSWHGLHELGEALHFVQDYIRMYKQSRANNTSQLQTQAGLKRKRSPNQLLTPEGSTSPKSRGISITSDTKDSEHDTIVFNAILHREAGQYVAVASKATMLDARTLPSEEMTLHAASVDMKDAEHAIRQKYISRLATLQPPVAFRNDVDRETPSLSFRFTNKYILRDGVSKAVDLVLGCQQCKPNMGANRGCEYTKKCDCLEFAHPDLDKLDDDQRAEFDARVADGENPSTFGLPKRFPYYNSGPRAGCLMDFYLRERHVIYECNESCLCGPRCKNRNVQHGRRVPLEIFKTANSRGFGLRCLEPLRRGQFIDTYLGEVITDAEANAREKVGALDKSSYLFGLDKFVGGTLGDGSVIDSEHCHVVDGELVGGPTRFMNHSCEPNVQIHAVSYNKYDYFVYDLAFFAAENVPRGQELTFDYMDADDANAPDETKMEGLEGAKGEVPGLGGDAEGRNVAECRCGAERCRRWLWQ
ncbi:hypothetical protein CAC42_6095 [Sphaceloma murrayae]|uniref:SET domain-containing protein n=1 Tax=Sphaceloma murrayae TaxID=2082308 RepID=A0A2K1QVL9_9PEZI|nr:hypothetical protein CAC42_6095 [Sphaceloma murrayae]